MTGIPRISNSSRPSGAKGSLARSATLAGDVTHWKNVNVLSLKGLRFVERISASVEARPAALVQHPLNPEDERKIRQEDVGTLFVIGRLPPVLRQVVPPQDGMLSGGRNRLTVLLPAKDWKTALASFPGSPESRTADEIRRMFLAVGIDQTKVTLMGNLSQEPCPGIIPEDAAWHSISSLEDGEFGLGEHLDQAMGQIDRTYGFCGIDRSTVARHLINFEAAAHLSSLEDPFHPITVRLLEELVTSKTTFFRDPNTSHIWEDIGNRAAEWARARRKGTPPSPFRVWSAGCSEGQEAWTLAIVLKELLGDYPFSVLGSDLLDTHIAIARRGAYSLVSSAEESQHRPAFAAKYFEVSGAHGEERIRKEMFGENKIHFAVHNLLDPKLKEDETVGPFNLIVFQNIATHLQRHRVHEIAELLTVKLDSRGLLLTDMNPTPLGPHFDDLGQGLYGKK